MGRRLIECVPNFSEGRNPEIVAALAAAACSVAGVVLLDQEMDADHNRSVLTLAGPPEAVGEAAIRAVGKAVELIDLNRHRGVHPRIGAADVVPFVPVEGVALEDCVRIAGRVGEEIWRRFQVPVYFYEAAARRPGRVNLEDIRRGQFEGLREEVAVNQERAPDVGEARLHPTAGATVVGARKFLIAYNINLGSADLEIARRIAQAIRFSSGGFRYVKAMGVLLGSRNLAQVSMNLTDFEQTPLHRVFEAVRVEAGRYGVQIVGSEIVGLIPKRALEMAAEFFLRCENFRPDLVLENRLAEATATGGMEEFLQALAAPLPTPGGGSAAAAAGAMAAALGAKIATLSARPGYDYEADRRYLASAIERDSAAYLAVVAAFKVPKLERAPLVEEALHGAATVPLEVAERAFHLAAQLDILRHAAPAKFASDVESACALAAAALAGALATVRINLPSIHDQAFRQEIEARLRALQ
jgi:glutamate formiminotransferase